MAGPSALALGLLASLAPGSALAQAVNLGGLNNIIADGRTQTNVSTSGNTTSITTNTVSQGTGFNSFSDFQQAAGTQVNMYVPDGAGNLVNIVRNGPIVIDGVLNAYKDGQIGGNIFFASSGGFIVGQNGVVNVGSLTVNTPTANFLEHVISPDGRVDDVLAARLMRGEVPISPDGIIAIAGQINADGGVVLQGSSVSISGQIRNRNGYQFDQKTLFQSSVNTAGLVEGNAMVVRNGVVSIVASNDARVSGRIDVGSDNGQAGHVSVRAGGDITLESTAELVADGADGGGLVEVIAGDTLYAWNDANISARSTGTGDGGFVELSGHTVILGALHADVSAVGGQSGTILIDPYDLYIGTLPGGVTLGANDSLMGDIVLAGNVILQADNSITLTENGTIDTTGAGAGSGHVVLEAPLITIANHARILAAGDITLDARATTGGLAGFLIGGSTKAGITIGDNATLSGRDISLLVAAEAGAGVLPVSVLRAEATISIGSATITASGSFTAQAVATAKAKTSETNFIASPLGVVTANVVSAITVARNASITAAEANLSASSEVDIDITTESVVPDSSPADGALAVSVINSAATVDIGGSAVLNITGLLDVNAENTVKAIASATPNSAAFGASVAVSVIDALTRASIGGSAAVNAGALDLTASTTTSALITAKAASGGGSENAPEQGSQTANYLDQYGDYASTGDADSSGGSGGTAVSVVGGLAVSDLTSTTTATIGAGSAVVVTGQTDVSAHSSNSAEIVADGSTVQAATGVGAAVGINLAKVSSAALVEKLSTGSLAVSAGTPTGAGNLFSTSATSGAGSTNVGIAGSFAVNLVDTGALAAIGANGSVTMTGADRAVALSANNVTKSIAKALPQGAAGGAGATLGIGGSAALNIVANRSIAELGAGASLSNASTVALTAEGEFTSETEASAGSAGGISITPALALSLINNTTAARLAAGAALATDGAVSLSAVQRASTTTTASGEAAGSSAAIGAALAIALVNDSVAATTARNVAAGGAVNLEARGASFSILSAKASATGGAAESSDGSDENGVDKLVDANLASAEKKQTDAGVGDADQQADTASGVADGDSRSASTSEGGLSVAAAVGVNVQNAHVLASVADGVAISAGGTLTLASASNTDGQVTSDGSAVAAAGSSGSQVGIGAAVSVNVVSNLNRAVLGAANHSVGGLTISALTTDVADASNGARTDVFKAVATSGAGGSSVGIAGSLALNIIDTESSALVASGATVTITGSGDVALSADNRNSVTAEALPHDGGASGGTVGVGASAAINILANRSSAQLANGASLGGAGDVTLSANGAFTTVTKAEAGSKGGVSITPALALSLVNNATTARLGTGTVLGATGSVGLSATQQASTTSTASGVAAGENVAIGAAVAVALVNDTVTATTLRNIDAGGAVSFAANGASFSILTATASAVGGKAADANGDAGQGESVDEQVDGQLNFGKDRQAAADVGDADQKDATASGVADGGSRSASTSEGGVSVAAAVGVNVQNAHVTASVVDGVTISAGGALTLASASNTDGQVTSDGSAVAADGSSGAAVGIGAAVSVNVISNLNRAVLGNASHILGGLTISALTTDVADASNGARTDVFKAIATSGAGGSSVGIAGSLALNIIDTEASALIASGANVTIAGSGDVALSADNRNTVTAEALPHDGGASGGTVGVGASAAINILANRSSAQLANGVSLGGAGDVTLSANGAFTTVTKAEAGSKGGVSITPALALSLVNNATTARLGTGSALGSSGAVGLSATQQTSTTSTASGVAAGENVAIGAAVAVALVNDTVTATTLRNINAGGAVSFAANGLSSSTLEAKAGAEGAAGANSDGNSADGKTVDDGVTDQLSFGGGRQQSAGVGDATQQNQTNAGIADQDGRSAQSEEGKVSVAAAVAVNVTQASVTAAVPASVVVTAGGRLSIVSTNTTGASATADASATGSQVGIAAAAAVNAVTSNNTASLLGNGHVANGITISALQFGGPGAPQNDVFVARASSGAGGSNIGIAGALGLNIINSTTTAEIGGSVNAGTGTSEITADSRVEATAEAKPNEATTTGDTVGIGASVALNIITTATTARLNDGATFTGGTGLAVGANSSLSTTTNAAAGASGGVAIDAVVAMALLNQTTTARIGTGAGLSMGAGTVSASATSTGTHIADAVGETKGGKVGVGASAALILGTGASSAGQVLSNTSVTSASLARNVTAGAVNLTASADRVYLAEATATAGGGKTDENNADAPAGNSSSSNSLEKTKDSQKGTEGGSKVQVAAAVGIAAAQDVVTARLENGVTLTTTGAVSIEATNTTDMVTMGTGAAVDPQASVGVGIGVALSIVNNRTEASVSDASTINAGAGNVAVRVVTSENALQQRVMAAAVAGAASKGVSVAGALAVGISTSSARAFIGDGVTVSTTGNVAVSVDNTSQLAAKALAGAYSQDGSAGVGASIATAYSEHELIASIGAGANITGRDITVSAVNHEINAAPDILPDFDDFDVDKLGDEFRAFGDALMQRPLFGRSNYYVEAIGGSMAPSGVAVQGSFAVMVFDDTVSATIGRSLSGNSTATTTVAATGDVTLRARNDITAKAVSGGIAIGSNAGVGVSSSVIVSSGVTRALLAGNAIVSGSANFRVNAGASQDIWALGLAAAAAKVGIAGVATVITSQNTVEALVGPGGRVTTAGAATIAAENDFETISVATGVAAGGKVGIGGAASAVIVENVTRAALANVARLDANGAIGINARSSVDALTLAAAGAGGGAVGVAAGAAVYVLDATTEALVGNSAEIGQLAATPGSLSLSASDDNKLITVSGALGGGGKVGAGAGAAVGVIGNTVTAAIGTNAKIDAANVALAANAALTGHTIAIAAGVGGAAGLAGAASVYSVDNVTTARIGSGAVVFATNNASVLSNEAVDIAFIAGSLAGSGAASVGASASVAVVNSTTQASIESGAQVTALALGAAVNYVNGYSPSMGTAAGAISAPNLSSDGDGGAFEAATGSDGEVLTAAEARRQGLRMLLLERDSAANPNVSARGVIVNAAGTTAVRSLAIGGSFSGGAAVSISANVPVIITNVLASIGSSAQINTIDRGTAPSSNQSVVVAAASDVYRIGVAGSVAGGTVGIGGGVETAIIRPTTSATIGANATVNAANDVLVTARARQDLVGAAAAGSVGASGAIAGGVSVFALESETKAEIGAGAVVFAQGNAGVIAEDITRSAMVAGSVAIDFSTGGMAGSIGVNIMTKRTSASIADGASVTALGLRDTMLVRSGDSFSGTRNARGVVVYANSNESLFTLGISGAGGAFAAFAGAVSVQLLDIATTASIGNNALINTVTPGSAHAGQDVVVVARNSTSVAAVDGGIAVSLGAGIAGAIDVGILRNTTAASIGNGANVRARNCVDVAGLQNVDADSLVISGAVGALGLGLAASVSVYSIGDGISLSGEDTEETRDNVAGTGDYVQGQLGDDTVSRIFADSDDARVRDISAEVQSARNALDVQSALSGGALSIPAGTSASIGSATLNAGGAVSVRSRDTVATHTITGAAAGGLVGLGAGIGIVTVETTNTAQISGPAVIGSGGLNLDANSSHILRAGSAAGSVGFAVAAQAAVAILTDNSVTRARITGAQIDTTGVVAIQAHARRVGDAQAMGVALGGGGAVGLSLAMVNLGGLVETQLGSAGGTNTRIGSAGNAAQSVSIGASAENLAIAETGAASGGIGLAAAGSVATAKAGTQVSTLVDRATIFASGQVKMDSEARSRALTDARGIALSGWFSVGGSLADARVSNVVNTTLTQNTITAGSVALGARTALLTGLNSTAPLLTLPGSRRGNVNESAIAYAEGSSGAFVGVTATLATAENSTVANLNVSGSALTVVGAISAAATTTTAQNATASGLAIGIVAVGANSARARSTATTQAIFTDTNVTAGSLALQATGNDSNFANATSGSGGVVAGAAAQATTTSASTTRALINATGANRSLITSGGDVTVAAVHNARFGGKVDSVQASAVGMSSANISHVVNSTVAAGLSDHARLYAANFTLNAHNFSHNYFIGGPAYSLYSGSKPAYNSDNSGWNVDSGSGGLINVPSGSSDVFVNHVTTAAIGANAYVHLLPPGSGVSRLRIEAYNEAIVQQRARLDSGGAIATADTEANITVIASAAVSLGENTDVIVDVGDAEIAAWGQADLEGRAVSTTYGLAGAPSGQAYITYNGSNTVDIARNMRLEVTNGIDPTDGTMPTNGTISVNAGASPLGRQASLFLRSTVDLFNNTAIPIDSKPDAKVVSNNQSNLIIHAATATHPNPTAAYGVSAAGDITLRAMGGNVTSSAVGIGKNIYLEALSAVASAISNLFGGGDVTFEIRAGSTTLNNLGTARIDGLVRTGLQRHKTLTISYATSNTGPNAYAEFGCDITASICLAPPTEGEIGTTLSGPVDVGTTILDRLAELRALLAHYGQDPVAAGAYRTEINFLENKLASLGLGHYDDNTGQFVPGAYVGPSPRDGLLAEAALIQADIITNLLGLGQNAGSVVLHDAEQWGISLQSMFNDASFGIGASATSVRAAIAALGNYTALTRVPTEENPNPNYSADFVNRYNNIGNLVSQGQAAAGIVVARTADNETRQIAIDDLTLSIRDAQGALAAALASGNVGAQATATANIANARDAISAHLTQIGINNGQIATQSSIAAARASSVRSELNALIDWAATAGDAATVTALRHVDNNPENAAGSGAMGRIARSIDGFSYSFVDQDYRDENNNPITVNVTVMGVSSFNTNLQSYVTGSANTISTLSAGSAVSGSLAHYVTAITGRTSAHDQKLRDAAQAPNTTTAPTAYVIDVDNVAARLGNVSIIADRLVGSGSLRAPGDAAITITNNTANILRLGNMLIPTYDAGNVRFNGVLVHSNADINKINPAGTLASFNDANIVTASSSSRPLVRIVSNYNPESAAYYDPSSSNLARSTRQIAPDIILKQGSILSNLTGAVEIESAAGNIYINGEILAGSVSILAKNGDFVSSYVNGFNHIGGDPGSFNIPTNRGESGRGIIANGAVSISARYININSTIQSGIAQWTANLNATPILTTNTPGEIGLTQTQINNAIAAYQTAVDAAYNNPVGAPSPLINLGNGIVLNMAPAGLDPAQLQSAIVLYLNALRAAPASGPYPNPLYTVSGQQINIKDFLSPSTEGRIEFSIAQAEAYMLANPSQGGIFTVVDTTSNIGVSYDTKNARYVLDGTSVRGGYIQLYGQIMNTGGSSGQLNVLDGFGTITVNNTSSIPVVLQTLNAGDDGLGNGRGTAGVIEITDVIGVNNTVPSNPRVDVKFTRYTRDYDPTNPGAAQIVQYSHLGRIDQVTGNILSNTNPSQVVTGSNVALLAGTVRTDGNNRTATYSPTANQRYVWTTGEYFDNTTNFKIKQTQLFGSSSLTIRENTHFDSVDGPHTLATYRLPNGTYVTTASTATGNAWVVQTNRGIVLVPRDVHTPNGVLSNTEYTSSTDAYINSSTGPTETGRRRDCNWWTLCIASKVTISYTMNQKYTVVTTNSLKADHPIAINFIGSDTGGINVNSHSNVVLTGAVTASNGTVNIASANGSIIQGNLNAQITANTINLNAAGSVGGVTNPYDISAPANAAIAVSLNGGALTAHAANGGVSVAARGDMAVNQVSAAGNVTIPGRGVVNLVAGGSISAANAGSLIQGPRVILTALNGSIGSTADGQQLRVNTGFTTDPNLRPFGDPAITPDLNPYYGLTATAAGDIGITASGWAGNTDGTILVDRVRSLGGDVRLTSTGYILDNNPLETLDSRTYAQLVDYWESLGLLADDPTGGVNGVDGSENALKQANTVAGFERARVQAYNQYWQLRSTQADGGADYDAGFTITVTPGSAQHTALTQQFDTMIRAENPAFTDQEVADAVATRIANYETAQTALYHELNAQVGGLTAQYDEHYSYTATSDEVAALTRGATWTERQLAFSLSAGALKTITSTNPVIKDPNVSGRNVTLEAGLGIGETIGAGTAHVGISIPANIAPSDMTIAQKVALAAAERSDLILNVGRVTLPANATPAQIAAYQAAVAQGLDQPGSTVDIQLGIDEGDMTPLMRAALNAAAQGLIPASDMTIVVLAKRPLNFDAPESINVDVTAPSTGTGDLGTAHLASRNNAALGNISVLGETRIKVLGSIINATGGSAVNTGNLILEAAQGGIGTGFNPATSSNYPTLQLNLRPNATFTARAQPGVDVQFAGNALIDTVYSPQDVRLSAPNGSILNANNDLLINILGTNVVLTASGSIGSGAHALNVGNNLGGGIAATAGQSINLFGSAGNQFVIKFAQAVAGSAKLTAALEALIDGQVSAAGRVDLAAGERVVISGQGTVTASTGVGVDAGALKMINGAALTAYSGRVLINTVNDALVTNVTALDTDTVAGSVVSIVAGGRVYGGTAPGRYDITALASGASVSITAGLGIGDKTQANDRWQDGSGDVPGSANAVTDMPNPLRIRTAAIELEATQGGINVIATEPSVMVNARADEGNIAILAAGRLHSLLLAAAKGSVAVNAASDIMLMQVTTGTDDNGGEGRVVVVSDTGAIAVINAVSGGSQSYEAEGDIVLGTLEAGLGLGAAEGAINVLSHSGLIAVTTAASGGSQRYEAEGDIVLGTLEAGLGAAATEGAIEVLTHSGAINVATATSGGSQVYHARNDITFGTLTTLGLPTDIGDVALTSTQGALRGGDIFANGSIYLRGNGVYFGDIVSGGDSEITSGGDIIGDLQQAGGTVTDIADGDIRIGVVRAPRMNFDAMGALVLPDLRVGESLVLRGGTIDVGVTHEPTGPGRLQLTLTGGRGTVGSFADVRVDAPQGITIPQLRFYESRITTTARAVEILEAYVPGSMLLRTPVQTILAENRTPTPRPGNNVQMYQPNFTFNLDLNGNRTFTDAYVVSYDVTADLTDILDRLGYDGASLIRDTIRIMYRSGLARNWFAPFHFNTEDTELELTFDEDGYLVVIDGVRYPIFTIRNAPALQLSELRR